MPTTPSRKQQQASRRARLDQMRKQQKRAERRSTALVVGIAALVGIVIIGAVGFTLHQRSQDNAALVGTSLSPAALTGTPTKAAGTVDTSKTATIRGEVFYKGLLRTHVTTPVVYAQTPPVGGSHNGTWLNCGIYNNPVPNENAVHDLEHGAVWITYQPSLPGGQVSTLIKLVKSYGASSQTSTTKGYVDLTPYPGLPSPVVASAWGVQLKLANASDARLKKFVDTYRLGPQTLEPGAACAGGVGSPRGTVTKGETAPANEGGTMAPQASGSAVPPTAEHLPSATGPASPLPTGSPRGSVKPTAKAKTTPKSSASSG